MSIKCSFLLSTSIFYALVAGTSHQIQYYSIPCAWLSAHLVFCLWIQNTWTIPSSLPCNVLSPVLSVTTSLLHTNCRRRFDVPMFQMFFVPPIVPGFLPKPLFLLLCLVAPELLPLCTPKTISCPQDCISTTSKLHAISPTKWISSPFPYSLSIMIIHCTKLDYQTQFNPTYTVP